MFKRLNYRPIRRRTPEQRMKAANFNFCRKPPKLIGYLSNVLWAIAKLMSTLCLFCNSHTCDYLRWKSGEDRSSSCWDIRSDMPISAVSSKRCSCYTLAISEITEPILTKLAYNVATILPLDILNQNCHIATRLGTPACRIKKSFCQFCPKLLARQCPLTNWEKGSRSIIYEQILIIWRNILNRYKLRNFK